jgi:hypothetical protein
MIAHLRAALAACRCGHAGRAHQHYRRGIDCGVCAPRACPKFRIDWTAFMRPADYARRNTR